MGMDLVPRNYSAGSFHFNWTGWSIFAGLLGALGCNISKMAGSNDGDRVDAKTARAWAKAIRGALKEDLVVVKKIPNKTYASGFYEALELRKKNPGVLFKEQTKLDDDSIRWLTGICEFLENSSGFRQC